MKKIVFFALIIIYAFISGCLDDFDLNQLPKPYKDCKEYFDARGEYHNSCKETTINK